MYRRDLVKSGSAVLLLGISGCTSGPDTEEIQRQGDTATRGFNIALENMYSGHDAYNSENYQAAENIYEMSEEDFNEANTKLQESADSHREIDCNDLASYHESLAERADLYASACNSWARGSEAMSEGNTEDAEVYLTDASEDAEQADQMETSGGGCSY
jgi:hypothetical protein